MEIISIIAVAIVIISLYDYKSTKGWQNVTSDSRNDVVFAERNKKYGAYEIRRNYNRNLIMVVLGVIASIGLSYGAYILSIDKVEELNFNEGEQITWDYKLDFDEKEEVEDIAIPDDVELDVAMLSTQIDFRTLQITDDEVTYNINTQDNVDQLVIGTQNVDNPNDDGFNDNNNYEGELDGKPNVEPVIQPVIAEPATIVDIEAEYVGGYKEMSRFFERTLRYPEDAVQGNKGGKVYTRFVVEKSGEVTNVTVIKGIPDCESCNKEAVRVVKKMPNWKPASLNGKVVRSYFTMPINFTLK